ncbi:hypothetical protein NM957_00055 (plasmid) [Limosilactobacillus reuteri]|uniref:hypothetical protein n=2 Tax=Limosilactobacillus reuteri TaxID=1598 RepID=UPI003D81B3D2
MEVNFIGHFDLDLIDKNFIPSAQIADELNLKKDTLQKRVKKGYYQGLEIANEQQYYDVETGGKDIKLLVWRGRRTICYSKMLYSLISLTEQDGRREFDFEYNYQDKITAKSYRKNFEHILARLRREIDTSSALNAKSKHLLHLLKILVVAQTEDYSVLLRWFENNEPEESKQMRQVLNGNNQPPL